MRKTRIQELLTGHDLRFGTDEERNEALKRFTRPMAERIVKELYEECGIKFEEKQIEGNRFSFQVRMDSHPGMTPHEMVSIATLATCVLMEELCNKGIKVAFGPPGVTPNEIFAKVPGVVDIYHEAVKTGVVEGMTEVVSGKVSSPDEVIEAMAASFKA